MSASDTPPPSIRAGCFAIFVEKNGDRVAVNPAAIAIIREALRTTMLEFVDDDMFVEVREGFDAVVRELNAAQAAAAGRGS